MRHFAAGLITNDQFEDRLPRSRDAAVKEVRANAWYLYDDLREYRLAGRDRLPEEARSAVARWVLFLGTDLEYEYPCSGEMASLAFDLLSLCTFGLAGWAWRRRFRRQKDLWPFFRRADFDAALAAPRLLSGRGVGVLEGAGQRDAAGEAREGQSDAAFAGDLGVRRTLEP